MKDDQEKKQIFSVPIIPMDIVLLPTNSTVPIKCSQAYLSENKDKLEKGDLIALSLVKKAFISKKMELHDVGTITEIVDVVYHDDDMMTITLIPFERIKVHSYSNEKNCFTAEVEIVESVVESNDDIKKLETAFNNITEELFKIFPEDLRSFYEKETEKCSQKIRPEIAISVLLHFPDVLQELLEIFNYGERLKFIVNFLGNMLGNLKKGNMVVKFAGPNGELPDTRQPGGGNMSEIAKIEKRVNDTPMSDEAKETATRELNRLKVTQASSQEANVIQTYLELILSVPWVSQEEQDPDIKKSAEILENSHFGMKEVKDTIIETLSVRILSEQKGKILCLVGPPGVGKTSIAKAIAKATDREYVKIALGGVRDEADIRGHRRTYVGAMPGNIIKSVIKAGKNNPLILLDEIDKTGKGGNQGDPANALLEALDPEQNHFFKDHYLDIPFDASNIFYVATANDVNVIDPALRDRMTIIELSSYTATEKFHIAKNFLVKKQTEMTGLLGLSFTDPALRFMIEYYTREAGVRGLEKAINKICGKIARKIVHDGKEITKVGKPDVSKYLGPPIFKNEVDYSLQIGETNGLSWSPLGGGVLKMQVRKTKTIGKIESLGSLGDVMKESARLAMHQAFNYVCGNGTDEENKRYSEILLKNGFLIHVPSGATPKDGPSAGITMFTAYVSAITGRKARPEVAMTGEIDGMGRVLPVGGLKEKIIAAASNNITKVIISEKNRGDAGILALPDEVTKKVKIVYVNDAEEVLKHALEAEPAQA